jgi:hypothetical protein
MPAIGIEHTAVVRTTRGQESMSHRDFVEAVAGGRGECGAHR